MKKHITAMGGHFESSVFRIQQPTKEEFKFHEALALLADELNVFRISDGIPSMIFYNDAVGDEARFGIDSGSVDYKNGSFLRSIQYKRIGPTTISPDILHDCPIIYDRQSGIVRVDYKSTNLTRPHDSKPRDKDVYIYPIKPDGSVSSEGIDEIFRIFAEKAGLLSDLEAMKYGANIESSPVSLPGQGHKPS